MRKRKRTGEEREEEGQAEKEEDEVVGSVEDEAAPLPLLALSQCDDGGGDGGGTCTFQQSHRSLDPARFRWRDLKEKEDTTQLPPRLLLRRSLCARLRRHGWAIIALEDEDGDGDEDKGTTSSSAVAVVRRASAAAHRFFTSLEAEQKEATRRLFDEVGGRGKGFVGYNSPTPAKELYRLRRGPALPWPHHPALPDDAFREPVEAAFALLEELVDDVMNWIDDDLSSHGEACHLLWCYCGRGSPPRRRQQEKDVRNDDASHHGEDTSLNETDGGTREEAESAPTRYATSPFDLFHYYNSTETESIINCSRHVDPGFMTVVPCAATPGLEVLDAATREWIKVEQEGRVHRDVALFCGQSLQTVSNGAYPGIVHWVSRGAHPRLSLVYELRPDIEERH